MGAKAQIRKWIKDRENYLLHKQNCLKRMKENNFLPSSIRDGEREIRKYTNGLEAYKKCYALLNEDAPSVTFGGITTEKTGNKITSYLEIFTDPGERGSYKQQIGRALRPGSIQNGIEAPDCRGIHLINKKTLRCRNCGVSLVKLQANK